MNEFESKTIFNRTKLLLFLALFPLLMIGCVWTQTKSHYLKLTESKNLDKEVPKEKIKNLRI
ncbi:ankyrin repeat domain-containing protein, partial [Leptospira biflexa]